MVDTAILVNGANVVQLVVKEHKQDHELAQIQLLLTVVAIARVFLMDVIWQKNLKVVM